MAQNTSIQIPRYEWTQITDADVAAITFQNVGGNSIAIKGTVDATAPTNADGALRYHQGRGERNVSLADLFPGIAAVRLWAYSEGGSHVAVSHA